MLPNLMLSNKPGKLVTPVELIVDVVGHVLQVLHVPAEQKIAHQRKVAVGLKLGKYQQEYSFNHI